MHRPIQYNAPDDTSRGNVYPVSKITQQAHPATLKEKPMTAHGTRPDIKTSLERLLEKHRQQIVKFKEHTTLVRNASDSDHLKVFFDHLMDEEDENLAAVNDLLSKVQGLPPETTATSATEPLHDRTQGHYAARDQNILTVGSLLGQKQ